MNGNSNSTINTVNNGVIIDGTTGDIMNGNPFNFNVTLTATPTIVNTGDSVPITITLTNLKSSPLLGTLELSEDGNVIRTELAPTNSTYTETWIAKEGVHQFTVNYIPSSSDNYQSVTGNTITVTATTPVTGITLNKPSTSLIVGDSEILTETIVPATATNQAVTWSSSNPSIATVDASGVVTAKAVGSAIITVKTTDGNFTATSAVTVKPATYTIDGGKLTHTFIGGTDDITFRVVEPAVTEAQSITVNGVLLDSSHYTLTSGSTIVTLKNSWLKTLSNNNYAVLVKFSNGTAGITLIVNQSTSSAPSTGETIGGGTGGSTRNSSKEFWSVSGSSNTASKSDSGSVSSADSASDKNYNPNTGGDVHETPTLVVFTFLAMVGSMSVFLRKNKERK